MHEDAWNPVAVDQYSVASPVSVKDSTTLPSNGKPVRMDSVLEKISDSGEALTRVLSRAVSRESDNPGPPPDGGLEAWMQAFMGHLVVFNTWGYINSFGVF